MSLVTHFCQPIHLYSCEGSYLEFCTPSTRILINFLQTHSKLSVPTKQFLLLRHVRTSSPEPYSRFLMDSVCFHSISCPWRAVFTQKWTPTGFLFVVCFVSLIVCCYLELSQNFCYILPDLQNAYNHIFILILYLRVLWDVSKVNLNHFMWQALKLVLPTIILIMISTYPLTYSICTIDINF